MPGADSWWIDERSFTYVGRMDPSKGVDVIVRAYASLAEEFPSVGPLWLVGGVPTEIERVRRLLRDLLTPLEERKLVIWWGFQRPAVISGLLSRSLALLMHSQYEPGGRVVLEALAAGLPVIATPNGFARELVRDWVSGFLVRYGDVPTLRTRMAHFLRQPLLRNALGSHARTLALDALSAWRFVDTHCDIYDRAIGRTAGDYRALAAARPAPSEDVLHDRAFAPTYPFSNAAADDALVEMFAQRYRNTLRLVPRPHGEGRLWVTTDGAAEWIVKQSDARFAVRPLWDPGAHARVRTAKDRFAAEVFAGSLPAFVPVVSHAAEQMLLLRPAAVPVAFTRENLPVLVHALRSLEAVHFTPAASFHPPLAAPPNDRWDFLAAHIRDGSFPASIEWTAADTAAAERFAAAAAHSHRRVVLAHGDPHPSHFVRYAGAVRLISGGDLEETTIGKDVARLLLHALDVFGVQTAQVLDDYEPGDRDQVLMWAALFAVEGLFRNSVLHRPARLRSYRQTWSLLRETCGFTQ